MKHGGDYKVAPNLNRSLKKWSRACHGDCSSNGDRKTFDLISSSGGSRYADMLGNDTSGITKVYAERNILLNHPAGGHGERRKKVQWKKSFIRLFSYWAAANPHLGQYIPRGRGGRVRGPDFSGFTKKPTSTEVVLWPFQWGFAGAWLKVQRERTSRWTSGIMGAKE